MPIINGVINEVRPDTVISVNGARVSSINGAMPTGVDKWRMAWNGNHFAPPPSGSVLYYPGVPGQGTVIQDFSGSGNNGTIVGATWVQLPSGLGGLSADGNDRVSIAHHASLDIAGSYTLKYWIVPDAAFTAAILTAKITAVSGQVNLRTFYTSLGPDGTVSIGQGYGAGTTFCVSTNPTVASVPNFACFVVDVDTDLLYVYLNGIEDNTAAFTGTPSTNGGTLWMLGFAAQGDFGASYSKSALYLQAIIPGASTPAQIMSIYQQERHLL